MISISSDRPARENFIFSVSMGTLFACLIAIGDIPRRHQGHLLLGMKNITQKETAKSVLTQ
jgi:hypothetical protein